VERRHELFRRAGVASMKGIGDVTVWEIGAEGGGAAALFQALGAEWLADDASGRRSPGSPAAPSPTASR